METLTRIRNFISLKNRELTRLLDIPVLTYDVFHATLAELVEQKNHRCLSYYAYPAGDGLKFIGCFANDPSNEIKVLSHELRSGNKKQLLSLTKDFPGLYIFEWEIAANFSMDFIHHPWFSKAGNVASQANSLHHMHALIARLGQTKELAIDDELMPEAFCVSLAESPEGEIVQCVITGRDGKVSHRHVTDPALHRWLAEALH